MTRHVSERAAAGADVDLVLDLLDGFRRSKTLFAAVQLGIFARGCSTELGPCDGNGLSAGPTGGATRRRRRRETVDGSLA
jgi:hypothetical protein